MQKERNASPDVGLGTTVLAIMGATALVAVLFLLSPWNVPQIADKSAPRAMYVAAPHFAERARFYAEIYLETPSTAFSRNLPK